MSRRSSRGSGSALPWSQLRSPVLYRRSVEPSLLLFVLLFVTTPRRCFIPLHGMYRLNVDRCGVHRRPACLGSGDDGELCRLELGDVLDDPGQAFAELRPALPRADRVDALPHREADVRPWIADVACEPKRPGAGQAARPRGELRPRLDERVLLPGFGPPPAHRVDLSHDALLRLIDVSAMDGRRPAFPERSLTLCGGE